MQKESEREEERETEAEREDDKTGTQSAIDGESEKARGIVRMCEKVLEREKERKRWR